MAHGKPVNQFLLSMPTTDLALVILAGGLGARFGGAKQIEPFGQEGNFLFEYACYDAMQAGFQKVFIIVRPGMQAVVAQQLNRWIDHKRYEIILQEQYRPKPWGTAHALHFLKGRWEGTFLVLNADDYYGPTLCKQAFAMLQNGVQSAALAFELGPTLSPNGPVARGLCQIENGYLKAVEEVLKIEKIADQIKDEKGRCFDANTLISMNAWLLPPPFLVLLEEKVKAFLKENALHENAEVYLPMVINELLETEQIQVNVEVMPAAWFGITYAADLAFAKAQILALETQMYPPVFSKWI